MAQKKDSSYFQIFCYLAIPIFIHIFILKIYLVNSPVMDDFDVILDDMIRMRNSNGFLEWLSVVVSQENEHRVVTIRLLSQTIFSLFGHIDFRWFAFIGSVFVISTLYFILKEYKNNIPLPVICAGAFLLFQFSYNEALLQSSAALSHLGVILFAFSSLYFALKPGRVNLLFCSIAGVLAACSQANGILVLPLAAVGCFIFNQRRRFIPLAILSGLILCLYFYNYAHPPNHPSIFFAIKSPLVFIRLFLITIGGLFPSLFIAQLIGAAILLGWGWLAWTGHWRRHPTVFLWAVFLLASALAIAAARAGFGLFIGSRYAVNATFLLILLLFAVCSSTGPWTVRTNISILLGSAVFSLLITYAALPEVKERSFRASLLTEYTPNTGTPDLVRFAGIHYPSVPHASRILNQASLIGLYSPPKRTPFLPAILTLVEKPRSDREFGFADQITVVGKQVKIQGWTDLLFSEAGRNLLIYPSKDIVSSRVEKLEAREDVAVALHRPEAILSGFRLVIEYPEEHLAAKAADALCVFVTVQDQPITLLHRNGGNCSLTGTQ